MTDDDGSGPDIWGFANAMLERSLPAIRAWFTSRLGAGARIGSVRLDQGAVVVEDAHIPIGARLWIDVDEARLDARPEDLMAGLPPGRLRSLSGALRATEGAKTTFSAPLEFLGGGAGRAWVDGEVRLGGATWKLDRGVGDALPMYGTAQLLIDGDGWKVTDAALTSGASQSRFEGSGSLREGGNRLTAAQLETKYTRLGHAVAVLDAFRGQPLRPPFPLPLDAIVTGHASLEPDLTWRIDATAVTERSDLTLKLDAKLRVIESAKLSGTFAPDELLPESLDRFVDREASAPLSIEATAAGPLDALDAQIELGCDALASPWTLEAHPAVATLKVDEARRYTLELDAPGAGRLSGRLGVAPYGSIDGASQLSLTPSAWALGPLRGDGEPAEVEVRIGGTRREPELKIELRSERLALRREGESRAVETKRLRAEAEVTSTRGRTRLGAARVRARLGPGSGEVERKFERVAGQDVARTHVGLARVDAANALAAFGLFFDQAWVGTDAEAARFVLPSAAQLWADLVVEGPRVTGHGHIETPRSRLSLTPLRFESGSFEGTEALATLGWEDAISLGLFSASPLLPTGSGNAELKLSLTGSGPATRVDVRATSRRVGWRTRAGRALPPLEAATLELTVGSGALEVRALRGTWLGGRLEATGALRREGDEAVARLEGLSLIGANRVRELLSLDPRSAALRGLSADVHLRGALGKAGSLEGHATLTSERSRLTVRVQTRGSEWLDGSELSGAVHPADIAPWTSPLVLDGGPMTVAAQLGGTFWSPSLTASVEGGADEAGLGDVRAPLADLRARLTFDADGVALHELSALLAGGRVRLRGLSSRAFGGAMARLSVDGVQLGAMTQISDELRGSLHLEASVWRRPGSAPGARLSARVEEPRYEALQRIASVFSRYGLKQPNRSSTRPLTATLQLVDDSLEVREVEAILDAMTISAAGSRSPLGIWKGDASVVVKQAFLETSHLFVRPAAWVGDVRIPVRIQGPEGRVRVEADVIAALDAALAKTRLGRGLQRAIDVILRDVLDLAPAPATLKIGPPRHHASSALASSDALIDRIAAEAPEANAALGVLLERGLEPEEIAERVIRRR